MPPDLTSVAVYRRKVAASLDRVWENVRDWEHLPWLHRTNFAGIDLEEEGPWGWRARIDPQPSRPGRAFRLELVIDADEQRYVSRTIEGRAAGSEIWTRLTPIDGARTDIEVEFLVPDVSPGSIDALGRSYTRMYTTLWDEDEQMMVHRQAMLDARAAAPPSDRAALELGPVDSLRPKLPLDVEMAGRRYRVVEVDGELRVHAAVCPHMLGPLGDAPLEDGCLACPWHGYRFDLRTGASADGRGLRLPPAPAAEVGTDGTLRLVWRAPGPR